MNVALLDHLIVILFFVGFPLYAVSEYRKLISRIDHGDPVARLREYRQTLVVEWVGATIVIAWWLFAGRSLEAIGLGSSTGVGFWIGMALALGVVGALFLQRHAVAKNLPKARGEIQTSLGSVVHLLPHTKKELSLFQWLSITAGICEELLFRGFLIWYLAQFLPLWAALVGSSVLFGYAHMYQGKTGAVRVFFIGMFLAGLFWLTGSLWIPMFVHAVADLFQGRTLFAVLREDPGPLKPDPSGEAAAAM